MASDVGYIRAKIETLTDLPQRVASLEIAHEHTAEKVDFIAASHERFIAKMMVFAASLGTLITATAAVVTVIINSH